MDWSNAGLIAALCLFGGFSDQNSWSKSRPAVGAGFTRDLPFTGYILLDGPRKRFQRTSYQDRPKCRIESESELLQVI